MNKPKQSIPSHRKAVTPRRNSLREEPELKRASQSEPAAGKSKTQRGSGSKRKGRAAGKVPGEYSSENHVIKNMTLAAYGRRGNAACNLLGELLELRKKCDSIISADAKSLRKAARALSEHWRTKPIRDPLPPHYKCGPLRFHSYEDLHLFDWLCAMARPRVANVLWLLFRAIEERDAKVFEHIASIIKHTPPNEPLSELADSDAYQMAREQLVDDKFSVSAHSLDELRDLTKSRASDRTMSRKARSLGLKLKERWPSNHGT